MPLPNEILKGRLVRGLQRFFAIQGDVPTPQLSPEVQPGYDVMNPSTEFFYLAGERLSVAFFDITGDATHPGIAQLINPLGSGGLVILERIVVSGSAVSSYVIRDANAGVGTLPTLTVGRNRDTRWAPAVGIAQVRTDVATAAAGSILATFLTAVGGHYDIPFPYVMTPSTYITVNTGANAQRCAGFFLWRERPLEDLEQRMP